MTRTLYVTSLSFILEWPQVRGGSLMGICEIPNPFDIQSMQRLEKEGIACRLHRLEKIRRYAVEPVYAEGVSAILRQSKENGRQPMAQMCQQLSSPSPAFEAVRSGCPAA